MKALLTLLQGRCPAPERWAILALCCLGLQLQAQDGPLGVTYDLYLNQTPPMHSVAELRYANGVSDFHWNDGRGESEMRPGDFGAVEISLRDADPIGTVNRADFSADSLYTRGSLFNEPYLLREALPRLGWKLEGDTKMLGGLTVYRATATFRGRLYTAWYYPDIPLPIGPWKLQGLPGIILEAYDAEAFFHAVFQAVGPASEVPAAGTAAFGPARGIDLDGFRELQAEMTAELIRRIRSKLPRGAQLTVDETYADFLERSFEQP